MPLWEPMPCTRGLVRYTIPAFARFCAPSGPVRSLGDNLDVTRQWHSRFFPCYFLENICTVQCRKKVAGNRIEQKRERLPGLFDWIDEDLDSLHRRSCLFLRRCRLLTCAPGKAYPPLLFAHGPVLARPFPFLPSQAVREGASSSRPIHLTLTSTCPRVLAILSNPISTISPSGLPGLAIDTSVVLHGFMSTWIAIGPSPTL